MPREVLRGGQHPVLLQSTDSGGHQHADELRIFTERAGIDDRIGRIVVDIGHRGECYVNAHGATFQRRHPSHLIGIPFRSGRGHAHIGGEGRASNQPEGAAAFQVGADQEREWRADL
jgi:hypothetical protein